MIGVGARHWRLPLTQERLKEVLHYDPWIGVFIRKSLSPYASQNVGDVAGGINTLNYVEISIDNIKYLAHRLAWLYVYGRWPGEIDHIDRDTTNNRLNNLLEVNRSMQCFNKGLQCNNVSGHRGVHWDRSRRKWMAYINWQGRRRNLGRFDVSEEAVAARQAAEIKLLGCLTEELKDPANRPPKFVEENEDAN
jgi:hypothetical protein